MMNTKYHPNLISLMYLNDNDKILSFIIIDL